MKLHLPFMRKKGSRSTSFTSSSSSPSFSSSSTSTSSKSLEIAPSPSWSGSLNAQKHARSKQAAAYIGAEPSRYSKVKNGRVHMAEQIHELEDAFRVFDRDGDGKISAFELGAVLRMLGDDLSEQELRLMVEGVDKDGDGYIDLDEFISLNSIAVGGSVSGDELRDVFHIFDVDRNGFISAEELYRVFQSLGEGCTVDECSRMIRGVDADGDGSVNFEEFQRMMRGRDGTDFVLLD